MEIYISINNKYYKFRQFSYLHHVQIQIFYLTCLIFLKSQSYSQSNNFHNSLYYSFLQICS